MSRIGRMPITIPSGVEATVTLDGATHALLVGNADFLSLNGIVAAGTSPLARLAFEADQATQEGETALLVAVDGVPAGMIAVADRVRPTAQDGVAALQVRGVQVVMLTGDGEATARAVAKQVGIDQVEGNVKPEGKAAIVQQLHAQGRVVAMVGDGINDAPALAAADIGIAIGGGTDIAIETAPVTLMRADLGGVAQALQRLPDLVLKILSEHILLRIYRLDRDGYRTFLGHLVDRDLERHHAVAEPLVGRSRVDRAAFVVHELDRGAAEVEVGEVQGHAERRAREVPPTARRHPHHDA